MALAFPGTETVAHFERVGFKIKGKRMFATYSAKNNTANIFLKPGDQYIYCKTDPENIYPVPNKWGLKGATTFELSKITKEIILEALNAAYSKTVS